MKECYNCRQYHQLDVECGNCDVIQDLVMGRGNCGKWEAKEDETCESCQRFIIDQGSEWGICANKQVYAAEQPRCHKSSRACSEWKAKDEPSETCESCYFFQDILKENYGACYFGGGCNVHLKTCTCDKREAKAPTRHTTGPERRYILRKRIGHQYIYSDEQGHFMRQWKAWECKIMNSLDFRYWGCECGYISPYGLVIYGGCKKHD